MKKVNAAELEKEYHPEKAEEPPAVDSYTTKVKIPSRLPIPT